ncbi:hypothetical protein PENTCL1PPCAC_23016, partial [Pristionchus entomophagus]
HFSLLPSSHPVLSSPMCLGGRSSKENTQRKLSFTDSIEKKGGNRSKHSVLSDPRSTTTRSGAASSVPLSTTGAASGGPSIYNKKPKTRGGSNEALPVEVTAKSPTRRGSTESAHHEGKGRTHRSTKQTEDDIPTLRDRKESRREGPQQEVTEGADESNWSFMSTKTTTDVKKKPIDRRIVLHSPVRPSAPLPPSRPSPHILRTPSPSHTVPLNEKSAVCLTTTATVQTQRTMDEETLLNTPIEVRLPYPSHYSNSVNSERSKQLPNRYAISRVYSH